MQTPGSNPDNNVGTPQVESLKLWSCVNCRRRKVRCDRRHPCAPCSRNKTECVFPVSGRIPRRSRDSNPLKKSTQKQTELLGRLRRLEAMVGDLGSQVEHVAAVNEDDLPLESLVSAANATSATPSETVRPDHGLARNSQTVYGNPRMTLDDVDTASSGANDALESSQVSNQSGGLVVTNNGDIVVDDRFWTVFCKEVSPSAAHGIFARRAGSLSMASLCALFPDMCTRWSKSSKPSMGPQVSTSMRTAAQQRRQNHIIEVIAASIISFSRIHLLSNTARNATPFHHRCCSSGRYTWIELIRS